MWTDEIQEMVGGRGQINVRASKGVHLVIPRDRIQASTGIIARTEKSVLFIIPWGEHWLIGTTDTDWNLDLAHPAASRSDVDYLLEHANRLLKTPLTHEDVVGVYAGLRPLLSGESDDTSQLSREHAVVSPIAGLVMVAGGKYTTYRVMAKDAVDAVVHGIPRKVPASCTDTVPLVGADGYAAVWNQRERLAAASGLHVARIEHLLGRYGSLVHELLDLVADDPYLGEPLDGAPSYLRVEAYYAAWRRGRPAPRRRADPAYPHLHRDPRPRGQGRRGGRRARRAGARLGRRARRRRGRPLPQAGGGRDRLPEAARRPHRRRRPARRARRAPDERLSTQALGGA